MKQLLDQWIVQPHKVIGLEITFLPENKLLIHAITVVLKNKHISIETIFKPVKNIADLPKILKSGHPLSVVFNGKGIMVRKTNVVSEDNPLDTILSNANPADFYHLLTEEVEMTTVCVVRKEQLQDVVAMLKENEFQVLQISLGFDVIHQLLPFLNTDSPAPIETNSFTLFINGDKNLHDFARKEINTDTFQQPEYNVGNQYVQSSYLLAFASAVQLISDNLSQDPPLNTTEIQETRKEFRHARYFKVSGVTLLSFVFILLLVNFLIYNYYFNKNLILQTEQTFSQDKREEEVLQLKDLTRKEQLLQVSEWLRPGKISFYADRIASLTPTNTILSSMVIYPLRHNLSGEHTVVQFRNDTIQLTGATDNVVEINQFMHNLRLIEAFKSVNLQNYTFKKDIETGNFIIEIITN